MESVDEARGPKAGHHLSEVMGGRLPIRKHGREDVVWLGARIDGGSAIEGTSVGVARD